MNLRACLAFTVLALLAKAVDAGTFTARGYVTATMAVAPALHAAEKTWQQAEDVYRAALFDAALPAGTLSLSNSLYDEADTALRLDRRKTASTLLANWNLYDSSRSPLAKMRQARLAHEAARLTYLSAAQDQALKALGRFYALYAARRHVETARTDLASREKQLADTKEQFDSGTRSRIELTQSEGDKLQSEVSLAGARAEERKSLAGFNEFIDAEPEEPQQVEVSSPSASDLAPASADLDRALKGNYGLRAARVSEEQTALSSALGIRAALPVLKIDASWSKTGLGLIGETGAHGPGNPRYGVAASLSFPFGFLGAQNVLAVAGRRAAAEAGEYTLRDAERAFKTVFFSAREDIALQAASLRLLEFQVKAQKEATENLLIEYSQGGAQFLQLDTAQSKLLESSNRLTDARNALELALAGYRALLGEAFWE